MPVGPVLVAPLLPACVLNRLHRLRLRRSLFPFTLVLSAAQWPPSSPLRRAFEAVNPPDRPHTEWHHQNMALGLAELIGVPGLITRGLV